MGVGLAGGDICWEALYRRTYDAPYSLNLRAFMG